jgi:hypothetical protein
MNIFTKLRVNTSLSLSYQNRSKNGKINKKIHTRIPRAIATYIKQYTITMTANITPMTIANASKIIPIILNAVAMI